MITQKVDQQDDLLGVYHEWIRRLADRVSAVSVICLFRGVAQLPENVFVYSLGKENRTPSFLKRVRYAVRFYRRLWQLRGAYDVVFVHMNKEYVLLGAPFWKLFGKKVVFWYNHPQGDTAARLAMRWANTLLYTSPASFTAQYQKAIQMPVGVVTAATLPEHTRHNPFQVIAVSRLSPVKNIHVMVDAMAALGDQKISVQFDLYGDPVARAEDRGYVDRLMPTIRKIGETIRLHPAVPNTEIAAVFKNADLSLNLTKTGSMDKTMFESLVAGCPLVSSNQVLKDMLPEKWRGNVVCKENDAVDCAKKIDAIRVMPEVDYQAMRRDLFLWVSKEHSLDALVARLCGVLSSSV